MDTANPYFKDGYLSYAKAASLHTIDLDKVVVVDTNLDPSVASCGIDLAYDLNDFGVVHYDHNSQHILHVVSSLLKVHYSRIDLGTNCIHL